MDGRAQLLRLISPLRVGDEVLPGLRLDRVSGELGWRLRLRSDDGFLEVELRPRTEEVRRVASTKRFCISYRHAGDGDELGRRACEVLAALVRSNENAVLDDPLQTDENGRVRIVRVATLLEPHGSPTRFYALNPYVGCLIGCRFCYAQSRLQPMRRMLGLAEASWGSWVDVRVNAPGILAAELAAVPTAPIKFCPIVTDPYHSIERRHRITRACLEVLADGPTGFIPMLLTRSAAILDDLDRIAAFPVAYAGVSLSTIDDDVRRHFEPRAASVEQRLEVLRRFRAVGVRTFAVVQPQLPGPLPALVSALADLCDGVSLDELRGEYDAVPLFDEHHAQRCASWQRDRVAHLRDGLRAQGVRVWEGELPPELTAQDDAR